MREFISVKSIFDVLSQGDLKRDALMFHKLVINSIDTQVRRTKFSESEWIHAHAEVDWLEENGVAEKMFDWPFKSNIDGLRDHPDEISCQNIFLACLAEFQNHIDQANFGRATKKRIMWDKLAVIVTDLQNRRLSTLLRTAWDAEIIPYSRIELPFLEASNCTTTTEVINIGVKFLPAPDEKTPWEQIIEFRSDPDSYAKFIDLRNWMNEISTAKLSPKLAEEKLEYLNSQFERHMNLHKMKTTRSTLETVVVSIAEIAENLVKFSWGKLAKTLFAVRRGRAALMETELTAPGNAVAYIWKARQAFSNGSRLDANKRKNFDILPNLRRYLSDEEYELMARPQDPHEYMRYLRNKRKTGQRMMDSSNF